MYNILKTILQTNVIEIRAFHMHYIPSFAFITKICIVELHNTVYVQNEKH